MIESIPTYEGQSFDFGGLGVHCVLEGPVTEGRFSIVEHPLAPRALAAPLHHHHREDELSYVVSGTLGALLGERVVIASAGAWVQKPRLEWHTFWNAGDTPCHILEIISPSGFENYFREVAAAWGDSAAFARINDRYQLEMRFDSVPELCARFGLTFPDIQSQRTGLRAHQGGQP
jgi:mannose-6-phosphate isomerase-like protein (cupin superfamily)